MKGFKKGSTIGVKINRILSRYDEGRSRINPRRTLNQSCKRIGRILTKEIKDTQKQYPKVDRFEVHIQHPIDGRWLLKPNEWCLYPFTGNFNTNSIRKSLDKLMWAMFHKHPAYAVNQMTIEDERVIANSIISHMDISMNVDSEQNTYMHRGVEYDRVSIVVTV